MVTFAEYMDRALYGPGGYYASGAAKSGRLGDYFTAPDVGPVFGRLLAGLLIHWSEAFARRPFHLVEMGAGEGDLARSIGQALAGDHPERLADLVYTAVERSEARRLSLKAAAASMPCSFQIEPDLSAWARSPVTGCFFANELIDAFAVHRVRNHQGRLQEAYVEQTSNGNRLAWADPSTPRLASYFVRLGIQLPEGYQTEINLAMNDWIQGVGQALAAGIVVLIDYGRPAQEYYHPDRAQGTLRGFRRHEVRRDVLAGEVMDMTADVDFTSLALNAQEAGLVPLAYMDMGSFLTMGARLLWEGSGGKLDGRWSVGLRYLVHPEGLGSAFQALILGKGIDPRDWFFEGNRIGRLGLSVLPHRNLTGPHRTHKPAPKNVSRNQSN